MNTRAQVGADELEIPPCMANAISISSSSRNLSALMGVGIKYSFVRKRNSFESLISDSLKSKVSSYVLAFMDRTEAETAQLNDILASFESIVSRENVIAFILNHKDIISVLQYLKPAVMSSFGAESIIQLSIDCFENKLVCLIKSETKNTEALVSSYYSFLDNFWIDQQESALENMVLDIAQF